MDELAPEPGPRIAPGRREDIGWVNQRIVAAMGRLGGVRLARMPATLGRARGLFRAWLLFASMLMPLGKLPRRDTEVVILRVAWTTGCAYEWRHHLHLSRRAGLTAADHEAVRTGPADPRWDPRRRALLTAADEMLAVGRVSDDSWTTLAGHLDERGLIEFAFLVGNYKMLAMIVNTLGIQPDDPRH